MGLFDFLKKKPAKPQAASPASSVPNAPGMDPNNLLANILFVKLHAMGLQVERHAQYLAMVVEREFDLAGAVVETPGAHPSLIQLMIVAAHPTHFPSGIVEHVVGMGNTQAEKIDSALDNYIQTTLRPILDGLSDSHNEVFDFRDAAGVLWHPKPGDVSIQGHWPDNAEGQAPYAVLRHLVPGRLSAQKFNWLKLYIARQPDGRLMGDCRLNNEPWPEGFACLERMTADWPQTGGFLGIKQFVMIRRCDAHDA